MEVYTQFSKMYFNNKKEIFTLMKHFMYIVGSIFSAYFLMITRMIELKYNLPYSKSQLLFVFVLVLQFITIIFIKQIKLLTRESKQLIRILFTMENEHIKMNLFQSFDSDFEFFGSFFLFLINLFSIMQSSILVKLTWNEWNNYLTIISVIVSIIFGILSLFDLYTIVFSDFNKKRIDTFLSSIIAKPYAKLLLFIYLYPYAWLIKNVVRFFKTLLMISLIAKGQEQTKHGKAVKRACSLVNGIKKIRNEFICEIKKTFIDEGMNKEISKINVKIELANKDIYEKRLINTYKNEKKIYLQLKKTFLRFVRKLKKEKIKPFLRDKDSKLTKYLVLIFILFIFLFSLQAKVKKQIVSSFNRTKIKSEASE